MSAGQRAQVKINWVTTATYLSFGVFAVRILAGYGNSPGVIDLIALLSFLVFGSILENMRCPECNLHVADKNDGKEWRTSIPPHASPQCARCGADIP